MSIVLESESPSKEELMKNLETLKKIIPCRIKLKSKECGEWLINSLELDEERVKEMYVISRFTTNIGKQLCDASEKILIEDMHYTPLSKYYNRFAIGELQKILKGYKPFLINHIYYGTYVGCTSPPSLIGIGTFIESEHPKQEYLFISFENVLKEHALRFLQKF